MIVLICAAPAVAQPVNNLCANATVVTAGNSVVGNAGGASNDGNSNCNLTLTGDVYHRFVPAITGTYTFSLCSGTNWDSVVSLHSGCPASIANEVACDDDGCRPPGSSAFGLASSLTLSLPAGQPYIVRISPYDSTVTPGVYTLLVVGPAAPVGACCITNSCSPATQVVCQAAGASYRGDYTSCVAPAATPSTYDGTDAPLPIPDNTPTSGGIATTITVPDSFVVGDVTVELQLSHSFAGDLTATLSHAGRNATLMQRIGGGLLGDDSNFMGSYQFADSAFNTIWQAAVDGAPDTSSTIPTGAHRAVDQYANTVSLRAAFTGLNSAGDWTLRVSDNSAVSTGTLVMWGLTLDRTGGDPCDNSAGACCAGSSCTIATSSSCSGPNRRHAGAGTLCNPPGNLQAPCCKADFNQVGGVTVQDVFDYLVAYFTVQPTADVNGNGVSVQDLFDFLGGYFAGCV